MGLQKEKWIDSAKFVAIIAVLLDHMNGILYNNQEIAIASYFSVALFIILAGINQYNSNIRNKNEVWIHRFFRNSKGIVTAYVIASVIYYVKYNLKCISVSGLLQGILLFNVSGHFYYVFLYVQLMLISRALFLLTKNCSIRQDAVISVFIMLFSLFSSKYTNILNIYGGGGKVFGGTFLFCFWLGMLFAKYNVSVKLSHRHKACIIVSGVMGIAWWRVLCSIVKYDISNNVLLMWRNPSGVFFVIMAIIVLFLTYGVFSALESAKGLLYRLVTLWENGGRHTLYIYLYHQLFKELLNGNVVIDNIVLKWLVYFVSMIMGPIIIEKVLEITNKNIRDFFKIK